MSQDPKNRASRTAGAYADTTVLSPTERTVQLKQRTELNVENSRALIAEREARRAAEQMADRMAQLQSITASLAKALTPVEVAEVVVGQAINGLGAVAGSLAMLLEGEEKLEILCAKGYSDELMEPWRCIPLDAHTPISDTVRTGASVWLHSIEHAQERYPNLSGSLQSSEHRAIAALPLIIEGHVLGAIGLSFDQPQAFSSEDRNYALTMAQQCAQALERARLYRKMELANRAKDQFLAMLSHELRTPLTPVLGVIQAIEESDLPDDTRTLVGIARRNIELEARLIDDLLDITRVIQGKLSLMLENVDAHSLIESVVSMCREEISSKKLTLTLELHAERHHVHADSARLQQVLWNLVKNAIKFTPERGTIGLYTRNDGEMLEIEVADTGVGIDPEMQRMIFNPFEQGGPTITRKFGGLGLGLAISKAIVDLHEGMLAVQSDGAGYGSTFTVSCSTIEEPLPSADRAEERAHAPRGEGGTIMLVDDHEDTVTVMRRFLEREGYEVISAMSVEGALELARRRDFDLLISDIGLPDGTGIDLIQKLKETRQVKGIALSGFGMEGDIQRSLDAGFSQHLVKPVMLRRLQETIQLMMKKGE